MHAENPLAFLSFCVMPRSLNLSDLKNDIKNKFDNKLRWMPVELKIPHTHYYESVIHEIGLHVCAFLRRETLLRRRGVEIGDGSCHEGIFGMHL